MDRDQLGRRSKLNFQDQIVKMTQRALEDIVRAAEALPADQAEFTVGGASRSALSQLREIALSASWIAPVIEQKDVDGFGKRHEKREALPEAADLKTIANCLAEARRSTSKLCKAISSVSDERLEEEVKLEFMGGTVMTVADLLTMHYWNLVYHLGQINQIALALGDRAMH